MEEMNMTGLDQGRNQEIRMTGTVKLSRMV
jgi:hypothetical protein